MASIASSDLFNCFITTAMSFKALSTRSPEFIAAQNSDIALLGLLSTNYQKRRHLIEHMVSIENSFQFLKILIMILKFTRNDD